MPQTFSNASVTFTFTNPQDAEAKPISHRIDYLAENADTAALSTLGTAFATLYPDLDLTDISTTVESAITADAPATQGDDQTTDQPTQ
ncbi:hypothetical protein [Lacticaseibacillus thailandensis]|uniref:Uncharacterized protein n=1 Tax=Lacticaseibacillus thailandensis DSM 22698 = JCM 13996 TaxID=1423810 RepID=A0A0R2C7C2_9LACO|nr:hypothetical protein [Lacticaseibacillus thailandensis]KRM87775.1 hypothetical protein FD19_GL000050 [Lacticaseibacillus thailandensis DSM 22698 = JCM 13996]